MIDQEVLKRLEDRVLAVLDGDSTEHLDVIGYGEISTVLRADGTNGPVAAKRLPQMSRTQFAAYSETLTDYLDDLRARGVRAVDSTVRAVGDDPVVPYCIQPLQPLLLVDELRSADSAMIEHRVGKLVDSIVGAVDDGVGLDGQVSNWAIDNDDLIYIDVTTPLLRDASGAERLDVGLFIASLPWALRGAVDRFLLTEILSHYYDPRAVLLDLAGNLHKERLTAIIPPLLDAANRVISPVISESEAAKYYRSDALTWEFLLRVRRADRVWQEKIRHRRYPYLLPGRIER
ncbi:hypothetical protein MNBD_ACTINO01-2224 [hydrothermal vent metagenome]|uniref:Aminoglycoside phosphotransferase domain-containing protein n=1 Tax=hydrothermal vent metagenome TaxID=652676 RepID=A0A3B0SX62_9ZZZZ